MHKPQKKTGGTNGTARLILKAETLLIQQQILRLRPLLRYERGLLRL